MKIKGMIGFFARTLFFKSIDGSTDEQTGKTREAAVFDTTLY
jgi:hypothetical protein